MPIRQQDILNAARNSGLIVKVVDGLVDQNPTVNNLTVNGMLSLGSATLSSPRANVLALGSGDTLQSSSYTSGLSGWQITGDGSAEFNNIVARGEFHSTVFVRDLIEAHAGSLIVTKSSGPLAADMVVPTSGTWTMTLKDPPAGGLLFSNSDICECKVQDATGAILDLWFTVSARVQNLNGTQTYYCTYASGDRSEERTFPAGSPVLDYGTSGSGGLTLTADLTGAPYLSIFTHAGAPYTTLTERVRLGNLNGVFGIASDLYGIGIGNYSGGNYLRYDPTNGFLLKAGAGLLTVDANGAALTAYEHTGSFGIPGPHATSQVSLKSSGGTTLGGLGADYKTDATTTLGIDLFAVSGIATNTYLRLSINSGEVEDVGFSLVSGSPGYATLSGRLDIIGGLNLGSITGAPTGGIRMDDPADVTLSSTGHAFQIGATTGQNMAIDSNEIMSRNNGATSALHLQVEGGQLTAGFSANSLVTINVASNAKMTAGLTVSQRDADDEIFALKSSDVAHGMTNKTETDTYLCVRKISATAGGAVLRGLGESNRGLAINGHPSSGDTTKSTAAVGAITMDGAKANGADTQAMGTNENILTIHSGGTCRFIFDNEGSAHADVEWIAFDDYDDVALLSDLQTALLAEKDPIKSGFTEFLGYGREELERSKIVAFDRQNAGHAMVNTTRLSMLLVGALRQLAGRVQGLEQLKAN